MKNLNLVELLRDCPRGMELDCTMFDNVTFVRVDYEKKQFPIEISISGLHSKYLTKEGCFHDTTFLPEAKCVIFPKGKKTWDGFHRPFEDGDIVATKLGSVFILKNSLLADTYSCYVALNHESKFIYKERGFGYKDMCRFATEEEKHKLFQAIKDNGYKWNAETKTLEKLIEPKFKVGDRIRHKDSGNILEIAEIDISDSTYCCGFDCVWIADQDKYELVPNKFDINTLKPFDKVLYRMHHNDTWLAGFYDVCIKNKIFVIGLKAAPYCIPYEGNQNLHNTTNDCDPFFKTWENNN